MSRREPAPATRMQRAGNGHSYYLDGEWCKGVTTILSDGVPKPGLMSWAAKIPADVVANALGVARNEAGQVRIVADDLMAELRKWQESRTGKNVVPWSDHTPLPRAAVADALASLRFRDLDQASGRGTEVHLLAHKLANGEEVEVPDELAGHVRSYLAFLDEWEPHDALVERIIVNRRWRYMGQLDMIATVDNLPDWLAERIGQRSGTGLFDIKTSRSGIYAETALQLTAYRHGETMLEGRDEVPMPAVDFVAAIHVRADGYDVYAFDVETKRRPTTFEIFLYIKQVGDWLDWKRGAAATIKSPSLRPHRPEKA